MHVIDWIPLHEIDSVEYNVQAKQSTEADKMRDEELPHGKIPRLPSNEQYEKLKRSASLRDQRSLPSSEAAKRLGSHVGDSNRSWLQGMLSRVESYTGLDIDGDGTRDGALTQLPPDFNPDTHEVQLIITTAEDGRNRGRLYVHVLEEDEAQEWIDKLHVAVKEAKNLAYARRMEEIYGHSKFSMLRAKTRSASG